MFIPQITVTPSPKLRILRTDVRLPGFQLLFESDFPGMIETRGATFALEVVTFVGGMRGWHGLWSHDLTWLQS